MGADLIRGVVFWIYLTYRFNILSSPYQYASEKNYRLLQVFESRLLQFLKTDTKFCTEFF